MIVDLHRDVRHPCRFLAVFPGEWPHEVVPVGRRDVQLLDYTLVERAVDLGQVGRRADAVRLSREVEADGYAFFVELEALASDPDDAPLAWPHPAAAGQASALLRRAQMLLAAAQACRDEVAGLGRVWPDDLEGLAATLKLERMTQGLLDRAAAFPVDGLWLQGLTSTG